jgi:choline dehydrogenase-like flavoprotein
VFSKIMMSEVTALQFVDAQQAAANSWDYIIVGAGAAGCVLASRLSEDAHTQVLLIEAGSSTFDHPDVSSPAAWPSLQGSRFDWRHNTTPQPELGGRVLPYPRGLGLGGSTAINALGYMRGAPQAYDRWQVSSTSQYPDWSFEALLPYFKRSETFGGGASRYHGGDGPLHVFPLASAPIKNPFSTAFHLAASAHYSETSDLNGASNEGAAWAHLTLSHGRRDSAATAYLLPAASRRNLSILLDAKAVYLKLSPNRCSGVDVAAEGRTLELIARRETLVCAGAIGSPRLLMLSGIGPAQLLESLGIPVRANRRGVGQNLQDHLLFASVLYESKREVPVSHFNHAESVAATHGRETGAYADILLMGLSVPFVLLNNSPPANAFSIVPAYMAPKSRGSVALLSADPNVAASIDPGYFNEPSDLENMVQAVDAARQLGASPELRDWAKREVYPGSVATKQGMLEQVRASVSSFYHPIGTCRMGAEPDLDAVVDPTLQVIGFTNLRVIDASIFPSIPQGMPEAATLAVAERAASLLREHDMRKGS